MDENKMIRPMDLQIIVVIYSLRIYAVNYCSGISITTLCHISRKVNIILKVNI